MMSIFRLGLSIIEALLQLTAGRRFCLASTWATGVASEDVVAGPTASNDMFWHPDSDNPKLMTAIMDFRVLQ